LPRLDAQKSPVNYPQLADAIERLGGCEVSILPESGRVRPVSLQIRLGIPRLGEA
jgi:hypothetical protein